MNIKRGDIYYADLSPRGRLGARRNTAGTYSSKRRRQQIQPHSNCGGNNKPKIQNKASDTHKRRCGRLRTAKGFHRFA